jgi:hypothetical protein
MGLRLAERLGDAGAMIVAPAGEGDRRVSRAAAHGRGSEQLRGISTLVQKVSQALIALTPFDLSYDMLYH